MTRICRPTYKQKKSIKRSCFLTKSTKRCIILPFVIVVVIVVAVIVVVVVVVVIIVVVVVVVAIVL